MAFNILRSDYIALNKNSNPNLSANMYLAPALINDMTTNGFTLVESDNTIMDIANRLIFKPSTAIDPCWETDPWYVGLTVWSGGARLGTTSNPIEYPYTGLAISVIPTNPGQTPFIADFNKYTWYPLLPATVGGGGPYVGNNNTATYTGPRIYNSRPYSYNLTIVNRGFAVNVYDQLETESMMNQGVFVVQRGVGCGGSINLEGKRPLYMVTNIMPLNFQLGAGAVPSAYAGPSPLWFHQIIREKDTILSKPGFQYIGTALTEEFSRRLVPSSISDGQERTGVILNRFPNRWRTPVTTDNGEYIMIFPYGICTNRFAYADEIDLIAVSKADAYQSGQIVPLNVYGQDREYTAFGSNNVQAEYSNAVRVFLLTNGPEFI